MGERGRPAPSPRLLYAYDHPQIRRPFLTMLQQDHITKRDFLQYPNKHMKDLGEGESFVVTNRDTPEFVVTRLKPVISGFPDVATDGVHANVDESGIHKLVVAATMVTINNHIQSLENESNLEKRFKEAENIPHGCGCKKTEGKVLCSKHGRV